MDPWNYNAPSSGSILGTINGEGYSEQYFDFNHEGVSCQVEKLPITTTKSVHEVVIKKETVTHAEEVMCKTGRMSPPREVVIKTEVITPQEVEVERKQRRRRSMSVSAVMETTSMVSHVTEMTHGIQKIHLSSIYENKQNNFHDTSTKSIRSMCSQPNINTSTKKFVSMAEAIYHREKDTPERFHTYSKKQEMQNFQAFNKNFQRKMLCVPQSPALLAKTRKRNVKIVSQKEIEDMEYEAVKNYHIKANPIPPTVLHGSSHLPNVERRALTKPVPFKLTEIKKKPPPVEKKIVFSAKPVPKHILEKPSELPKKTVHVTIPKSPRFIFKGRSRSLENLKTQQAPTQTHCNNKVKLSKHPVQGSMDSGLPDQTGVGHSGVPLAQRTVCLPRKPMPFSFEKRDREMMRKKEEKIQMYLEQERKLREFHANPLPNAIKKTRGISPKSRVFEKRVDHHNDKENEIDDQFKAFKARPPVVLSKSPFRPLKKDRPVLEPCKVQLTTEIRAQKRNIFNQNLKEKEELLENLKKTEEEERQKKEAEDIAARRTQLVHKAAPVRHYVPVIIHSSEVPLTKPESPNFSQVNHKKI